jgi:hypothetical protein
MKKQRTIDITIRGFDSPVEDILYCFHVSPTMVRRKGEPLRPKSRPLPKSIITFSKTIPRNVLWDDIIDDILNHVGGISVIQEVVEKFNPELIHVDITLPVRSSVDQEDGYVSSETMIKLSKVGSSLGFSFI